MQQLKHHPDLGGDTATAALINEAYAILNDPERRAEYDAQLDILESVAAGFTENPADTRSHSPAHRVLDPTKECVFCETPHTRGSVIDVDDSCENCHSPLCVVEDLRIESSDQRAVARIGKRLQVLFYTHWPQATGYPGRTKDISPNGLRLETKSPLTKDQYIKISSSVFDAVGSVTNCVPARSGWSTKYVAGVAFVTLRFTSNTGAFVSRRV